MICEDLSVNLVENPKMQQAAWNLLYHTRKWKWFVQFGEQNGRLTIESGAQ